MMVITALLMSVMMLTCGAPQAGFTTETAQRADFKERDETNQTYQLGPGARRRRYAYYHLERLGQYPVI